jgi:hypothetical protein
LGFMPMASPIASLPLNRNRRRRRIGIAARDGATSLSRKKRSLTRRLMARRLLLRSELARDAHADALWAGLDDAGRRDRVLRLQAGHDRLLIEAKGRDLFAGRKFEIDRLVLGADQVDLAGIGHGQDLGARIST